MQVSPYNNSDALEWDAFVTRCPMATFLHTRRFLSYHQNRFKDVSVLIKDGHRTLALFPAAVDPADSRRVVSHPGITFGGLLHAGDLVGEQTVDALTVLRSYYAGEGFDVLRYKTVPYFYHQRPSGDDLYALFRLGAVRSRSDLLCVIELANRGEPGSRRKRGLKKALGAGVEVIDGEQFIDSLWTVLEDNLQRKLQQKPVHTRDEITYLKSLFPENISFLVGRLEGKIVAGLTLFSTRSVTKAQYIASSQAGYDVSALDAILDHAITHAAASGFRYFDFGASNKNEGQILSAGLYQFKSEFGAGGVAHDFYDLSLNA